MSPFNRDDSELYACLRNSEALFRRMGEAELAEALGKIAKRFSIHHIDGNPNNHFPGNLRIVFKPTNRKPDAVK